MDLAAGHPAAAAFDAAKRRSGTANAETRRSAVRGHRGWRLTTSLSALATMAQSASLRELTADNDSVGDAWHC